MTYAMMAKTTKLMPLKRHRRSQNPRVVYKLVDDAMAVVDALMRCSALSRWVTDEKIAWCLQREVFQPMTRGKKRTGQAGTSLSRFRDLLPSRHRRAARLRASGISASE